MQQLMYSSWLILDEISYLLMHQDEASVIQDSLLHYATTLNYQGSKLLRDVMTGIHPANKALLEPLWADGTHDSRYGVI